MREIEQDFIIDRLTDSILNRISGDSFQTEISTLKKVDLKSVTGNMGWNFSWGSEFANLAREVYKLTIINNPHVIQGLVSVTVESDHIFMNLLESAPFNIGENKLYEGVAGNLVAYACKRSFQQGFDGFVAFTSKTQLIQHYQRTLGAILIGNQRMIIDSESAEQLVIKYFKT